VAHVYGAAVLIYVLLALTVSHGQLHKEHIAVFGSSDTCQSALTNMQAADRVITGSVTYVCQRELLRN
jgi:hypothetical protein